LRHFYCRKQFEIIEIVEIPRRLIMRFFNTAGPIDCKKHYCAPPLERLNMESILALIDQEKYFVLNKFSKLRMKKRIARDIATSDPECKWIEEAVAQKLGVKQQTVNTWIYDIRAQQKASRNIIIIRLSCLG